MTVPFLTDFSDRISPMLVKELRQGLRAKTFVALFLSLQVFLMVMLLSASAASSSDQVGSMVSGIIFAFFGIAVLVVQPLRGTNALSSEIKGNTIDMMVLTRLSSWRIVFGKWVAIVGQSALLFSTIIPYLILRYFFGGMNLFTEVVLLLIMFLTSMALTAVTVGLSACTSIIIRGLIPLFGLPVLLWTLLMMVSFRRGSGPMGFFSFDDPDSLYALGAYLAAILYVGGSLLSMGTSLIAPAAENHSILRRLVAFLAMLALCIVPRIFDIDEEWVIILTFVVATPAIIIALTESAPLVAIVCQPFARFGILGRAIGWILYPTSGSGALFSSLIGFLSILAIFSHQSFDVGDEEGIIVLALVGSLFFPAVWQVFLFRGEGQRIANYLLLLAGSYILLGLLAAMSDSMNSGGFLWCFGWHPLAYIAMLSEHAATDSTLFVSVLVLNLFLLLILTIKALREIRASSPVTESIETPVTAAE